MDDQRQILTYTLRAELGHDRLGRVFRAVDARTMKSVIVRLMRVATLVPAEREEAVRIELRRAMRAAANVAHPNLAPIIDISSHRDLEIVAWDDFGGTPLVAKLNDGAPAVEALRWAIETASAIARAHSRDVTHGRLSLANIMVARDDGVRVLDLGVPRPGAIPFLVEDEPDTGGVLRPARRNLAKLMRHDVATLAEVVQEIVSTGPPLAPDQRIRDDITEAVREACTTVLALPRPTVSQLHLALVEVARRTPTDGRPGSLLVRPAESARTDLAAPATAGGTAAPAKPDPVPFALAEYENTSAGGLRRNTPPAPPPLRVWGAAAFELEREAGPAEVVEVFDPREPPLMTTVLLPPLAPGQRAAAAREEEAPARRIWPQLGIAVIIGALLAVGLFTLQETVRGRSGGTAQSGLAARDAAAVAGGSPVAGSASSALTAAARPVARAGQPSGTLVIAVTEEDVLVSVDGSRAEPAPVTWEDLPAGRRVVRVTAPGFQERVDTVDVRPDLTTTRYYILTPVR